MWMETNQICRFLWSGYTPEVHPVYFRAQRYPVICFWHSSDTEILWQHSRQRKDTSKLSPKGFLSVEILKGSKHHYSVILTALPTGNRMLLLWAPGTLGKKFVGFWELVKSPPLLDANILTVPQPDALPWHLLICASIAYQRPAHTQKRTVLWAPSLRSLNDATSTGH